MGQLVSRLDVAMFNAILRESAEEMPTDPVSDPISDSKVLPIPAGQSSFGAGAQLKNAVSNMYLIMKILGFSCIQPQIITSMLQNSLSYFLFMFPDWKLVHMA